MSEGVRGRLFGTHCLACRTEFTDEDVPVYHGPLAALSAVGFTATCRYCRQLTPDTRKRPRRHLG